MWSVVEFNDDRSVEAVPSFWIKNKKCAWPKKNSKKNDERRCQPNEIEFDFLKVRVLGNNIGMNCIKNVFLTLPNNFNELCVFLGNYSLARVKAKKAEYMSDLSTNDSSSQLESSTRSSKGKKMLQKQKQTADSRIMWSPKALDNSCKLYFVLV